MTNADDASLPSGVRPTLRDIARRLGKTTTTVSRALHNSPKISAATRARVQEAAREIGYRPDPELAKLMQHLRSRQKLRFHGALAALTTRPHGESESYLTAMLAGARRAADALGHSLELFHVEETGGIQRSLQRMLVNRGVEGILLLPMARPVDAAGWLDWERFAAVAATASVLQPRLHRITPDHFSNIKLLCTRLLARGYRRIGLVVRAGQDVRTGHGFTAGVTWHNARHAEAIILPLVFDDPRELTGARFNAWLKQARADAIIATDRDKCEKIARLVASARRRIELVSTNTIPGSSWSGIDERPAQVGATAVETLAGMIQCGTRGMSVGSVTTLVEGVWCDGSSTPLRD